MTTTETSRNLVIQQLRGWAILLVLLWIGLWSVDVRLVALPWLYAGLQAVLGLGLSLGLAWLSYTRVELPCIRWGAGLLRRHRG